MTLFADTCARIVEPCAESAAAAQRALDAKTKPRRSLGRLETLACQLAAIRRTPRPELPSSAIVVMAGDHGVADEGVSAYPKAVTAQMLANFAGGGAAINVLARQANARLVVVDMGVEQPPAGAPGIVACRIGAGTRNFAREPAMTREQAIAAIEAGIGIAHELAASGVHVLGLGEMGIGNTTSASALAAALTGTPVREVVGPGTGLDAAGLERKAAVIEAALARHEPARGDALGTLAALGGFEIAGLCGVALGGASARLAVVLDGFIASTAALVAARLCPHAAGYFIAAHRSAEPGHRIVLSALAKQPLLELDLRLGEGTGAALALPLLSAALRILHEMATFESAGVTDAGA